MIIAIVVLVVLLINASQTASSSQTQIVSLTSQDLVDKATSATQIAADKAATDALTAQNKQLTTQAAAIKANADTLTLQNQQIAAQAAADKAASDSLIAQKNQVIATQVAAAAAALAVSVKTYQRPPIGDKGFVEMTNGWYDAQGLGGCYDYCRYVSDRGANWFSCILADLNGSANPSTTYTPKGLYTEAGLASKKCAN